MAAINATSMLQRALALFVPFCCTAQGVQAQASMKPYSNPDSVKRVRMMPVRTYEKLSIQDVSKDGRFLLFWGVRQSIQLLRLSSKGGGRQLTPAPSGNFLAVVDRATGVERGRQPVISYPMYAHFVEAPNLVVFEEGNPADGKDRRLWRVDKGEAELFCLDDPVLRGSVLLPVTASLFVGRAEFGTIDPRALMIVSRDPCRIQIRADVNTGDEAADGRIIDFVAQQGKVAYVVIHRMNGKKLLPQQVLVRSLETLQVLTRIQPPGVIAPQVVVFTPDGKRLIVGGYDVDRSVPGPPLRGVPKVLVYESDTGRLLRIFDTTDAGYAMTMSPDGQVLAVTHKRERESWLGRYVQPWVALYDINTGTRLGYADFPEVKEPRRDPFVGDARRLFFVSNDELMAATYHTRVWKLVR